MDQNDPSKELLKAKIYYLKGHQISPFDDQDRAQSQRDGNEQNQVFSEKHACKVCGYSMNKAADFFAAKQSQEGICFTDFDRTYKDEIQRVFDSENVLYCFQGHGFNIDIGTLTIMESSKVDLNSCKICSFYNNSNSKHYKECFNCGTK